MNLKDKIQERLTNLQIILESNRHLQEVESTEELIDSISKFWSILDENDKEYIQAARYALDKKIGWK